MTRAMLEQLAERPSLEARFWAKVDKRGADECWEWTAYRGPKGYGEIGIGKRTRRAHQVSYELAHGAVPAGLQIDHLCRNRGCVNPAHLEAVTPAENTRRGDAGMHRKIETAQITHCPQGHAYDQENTYVSPHGKRYCRSCWRDRYKTHRTG